tara:strand:+ start:201 stop:476 length:276 start_codon:yes stop_codon:yes gene_type:complete
MIDKLDTIDSNLNKLEELNKNKFSSLDFKEVNQQLEIVMSELASTINIDQEKTLNPEEQVFLQKILNKIEKLELKILPKANLLNSFSKSII